MWAMAAMVVAIVATLLLTLFSDETHQKIPESAATQPNHQPDHHATRRVLKEPPSADRPEEQRPDAPD